MERFSRLLADVTPLRESPAFRRLWAGSMLSGVGSALTAFAITLQVYEITKSSFAVGAIGLAQMIPTITVGLVGGSLSDAMDRRRLAMLTSSGSAVVSAALAAQAFAGLRAVWLLYVLVVVQSSLLAISQPIRQTFIPALLPPALLPAGMALNRISFQVMLTVGPALAGVITAVPELGLRACYALDALTFAAGLYGIAGLPVLASSRILAGAFLADLNATIFGLPIALFPAINAERFGGNPRTLGLFATAIGVGGLVSSALSGRVGSIVRQGRAMLYAVAIWGAAFAGFAVVRSLWLTIGLLAVAGAADTFTVIFRGTIVQQATPEELRGRVTAADYVVGAGGSQLGNLEAGALGSLTTPTISALTGGLTTVAGAVLIGLALPAFTRYRAATAAPPAPHTQQPEPLTAET